MTLAIAFALAGCDPAPPSTPEAAPAPARPNFLIVTLDTTRADALTPYGAPAGATPTATRLADEGIRFTRAYTVTPLTIPAHSSLFTGLWPTRHGVRDNGDHFLAEGADTLAEALRDSGYATMASVGAEVTSQHWGFAQGFDAYFDDMGAASSGKDRWRIERPGEAVVADAITWLKAQDGEQPFLAWVHLFDAHHPYQPQDPTLVPGNPYLSEVAWADRRVGDVLSQLEAQGRLDHTWVFLMADHGEALGSHGERTHGVLLYDDTMQIPLIVRPPGGTAPRVLESPASITDITPTILGLAGLPMPDPVDGLDLSPWLQDASRDTAILNTRAVYMESLYAWHHYGWAPQRAIVDPRYKLIDSTRPELYIRDDIGEREDLAGVRDPIVAALRAHVDKMAERMTPIDHASDAAALDPSRVAQLEALGYMSGGDTTDREVPFRGDLEDPVSRLPMLQATERIRMAMQSGDLPEARRQAEGVLAREPGLDQVRMQLIRILGMMGEEAEAMAMLQEMDREKPSSNSRFTLAQMHLRKGEVDAALLLFEEAIDKDPYRRDVWTAYLEVLFATGDLDRMALEHERAGGLLGDDPMITGFEGVIALARGDATTAEPLLTAARQQDPKLPMVSHALGLIHARQGQHEEAASLFEHEMRINPGALPARHALAASLGQLGRYTEQAELLAHIRAGVPPDPRIMHAHAQALFNARKYDEALAVVAECEAMPPVFPECVLVAANALDKLGRKAEAQAAFARAVQLRDAVRQAGPRR